MGNNTACCGGRREPRSYGFREQDLDHLNTLFQKLVDSQAETRGGSEFNRKALVDLFNENPEMGHKVYKFMKYHSKRPTNKSYGIDYDTFLATLEVLTGENSDWHLRQYKKLGKHLLLAVIWTENHNLIDEQNFKETLISYADALDFVKCILNMFSSEKATTPTPEDDSTAKLLIDGAFDAHEGVIDWWTFLHYIRQNLIHLSTATLIYFQSKFLNKTQRLKLPDISVQSSFLTKDILTLFALSNIHIRDSSILRLIYSSSQGRHSFEKLSSALKHQGGTLILVSHSDEQSQNSKPVVFGAFANKPWVNNALYSDDDRSYVFSLFPRFQNFFHRSRTGEDVQTNFTYFNSDRNQNSQVGIGLGGTIHGGFRFWLDEHLNSGSYVNSEDGTYENGAIVPSTVQQLNIDMIEVWGLESSSWTSNVAMPATIAARNSQVPRSSAMNRQSITRPSMNLKKIEFRKTETTMMQGLADLEKDRSSIVDIRRTIQARDSKIIQDTPKNTEVLVGFNNIEQDDVVDNKSPSQGGGYFNRRDETTRYVYQPPSSSISSSQRK